MEAWIDKCTSAAIITYWEGTRLPVDPGLYVSTRVGVSSASAWGLPISPLEAHDASCGNNTRRPDCARLPYRRRPWPPALSRAPAKQGDLHTCNVASRCQPTISQMTSGVNVHSPNQQHGCIPIIQKRDTQNQLCNPSVNNIAASPSSQKLTTPLDISSNRVASKILTRQWRIVQMHDHCIPFCKRQYVVQPMPNMTGQILYPLARPPASTKAASTQVDLTRAHNRHQKEARTPAEAPGMHLEESDWVPSPAARSGPGR